MYERIANEENILPKELDFLIGAVLDKESDSEEWLTFMFDIPNEKLINVTILREDGEESLHVVL